LSDILQVVDRGNSAALVLLDTSATFDTIDHEILLQRLQVTFGIYDTIHRWFQSYLLGQRQYVRRGLLKSSIIRLTCGVPQGSVLGPLLCFDRGTTRTAVDADRSRRLESTSDARILRSLTVYSMPQYCGCTALVV